MQTLAQPEGGLTLTAANGVPSSSIMASTQLGQLGLGQNGEWLSHIRACVSLAWPPPHWHSVWKALAFAHAHMCTVRTGMGVDAMHRPCRMRSAHPLLLRASDATTHGLRVAHAHGNGMYACMCMQAA